MTESSPQPHVTKAADQIKSFPSFKKKCLSFFLYCKTDFQRQTFYHLHLIFKEKNDFIFSSQRLLFQVFLCCRYCRSLRNISLAEWRLGQFFLLLRGGGGGPGRETERGAGGERGRGGLSGVRQTYQSYWDWVQETSQVFLQSQEGRREKVRLVTPSYRLTGVACRISGVLFEAQPQVVSQADDSSKISVIESQDENDKSSQPE